MKTTFIVSLLSLLLIPNLATAQNKHRGHGVCNPVQGSTGRLTQRDRSRGQGSGRYGTHRSGGRTHNGIDIHSRVGRSVHSIGGGKVILSRTNGKTRSGNAVVIQHKGGRTSHYSHLSGKNQPAVGTRVRKGDRIGTVGRSGNVPKKADTHLHFGLRKNGKPVKPVLKGAPCHRR